MTDPKYRNATEADIPRVVELINRAFEVERAFKNGDRTDAAQVANLFAKGRFLLMESACRADACVYLERHKDRVYLGMLSVDPERQGRGAGSALLEEVERQSRVAGVEALDLRFVHLRDDLRVYYLKRGFAVAGTEPSGGVQNFTKPVHFVLMSKRL